MGRIVQSLLDLLRFQVPVIDGLFSFLVVVGLVIGLLALCGGGIYVVVIQPLWHLIGRPIAVAYGMVPLTGYDYVVRAWKAERQGNWAEALRTYDQSISLFPRYEDARRGRDALLAAHPELAPDTTPPTQLSQTAAANRADG